MKIKPQINCFLTISDVELLYLLAKTGYQDTAKGNKRGSDFDSVISLKLPLDMPIIYEQMNLLTLKIDKTLVQSNTELIDNNFPFGRS